jgi:hypothetical protein
LPVGLFFRIRVKASCEKYFAFSEIKSGVGLRHPAHLRGASRSSRNVLRDAMDEAGIS